MTDSLVPTREKPPVGEPIEERIVNFLNGLIQHEASADAERRLAKLFFREELLNFVSGICPWYSLEACEGYL